MSENIKDFNAQDAVLLSESFNSSELIEILEQIKIQAAQGERRLHVYEYLQPKTLDILEEKLFKVAKMPSIAIQKEGLYYTITW